MTNGKTASLTLRDNDRSAYASLSPTRLVDTSRFWLTGHADGLGDERHGAGCALAISFGRSPAQVPRACRRVGWVGLYSGGNRLRLRLPLTSQNQAPLRGSCPLYDRFAIAPLSPTRLVRTSRLWLTGSLSLTRMLETPPY